MGVKIVRVCDINKVETFFMYLGVYLDENLTFVEFFITLNWSILPEEKLQIYDSNTINEELNKFKPQHKELLAQAIKTVNEGIPIFPHKNVPENKELEQVISCVKEVQASLEEKLKQTRNL